MSIWDDFLKEENVKKIEKKNKQILFYKRICSSNKLNSQNNQNELSLSRFEVNIFDKKNKRNFKAQAVLDLHGYTVSRAMSIVQDFFFENAKQNIRNLLIITGGSEKVNKAIRVNFIDKVHNEFSPLVSMISTASKENGGTGAFYVKLRKNFNNTES